MRTLLLLAAVSIALSAAVWFACADPEGAPARPWPEPRAENRSTAASIAGAGQRSPAVDPSTATEVAGEPSRAPEAEGSGELADDLLRVRVIDEDSRALPGAEVEILRARDELAILAGAARTVHAGRTGPEGAFEATVAPGAPYRVHARAPGRAPAARSFCYGGSTVELRLARAASITGRVTLATDGSVVRATLVARARAPDGERSPGREVRAETDLGGSYRFDGLAPGAWSVVARPFDAAPTRELDLELEAGESERLDIAVAAGIELTGTVRDASTTFPVPGARVAASQGFEPFVTAGANGEWTLRGVPPGAAAVFARAHGYAPGHVPVALPGARAPIEIALQPGLRAIGRVLDARSAPVGGAEVHALSVLELGGRSGQRVERCVATSAADGRFELADLCPDLSYTLLAGADGRATVLLDLPAAAPGARELDLGDVVLPDPGSVRGTIVDELGQPYDACEVVLQGSGAGRDRSRAVPDDQRFWADLYAAHRVARTDARGRFAFLDLAAGGYELVVPLPGSHEVLRREIEVPARACRDEPVIVVPRGAEISGRVAVDDLGAVPRVYVSADPIGPGRSADAECALDGAFVLRGLTGASYRLTAWPYPRPEDELVGRRFAEAVLEDVRPGGAQVEILLRRQR